MINANKVKLDRELCDPRTTTTPTIPYLVNQSSTSDAMNRVPVATAGMHSCFVQHPPVVLNWFVLLISSSALGSIVQVSDFSI